MADAAGEVEMHLLSIYRMKNDRLLLRFKYEIPAPPPPPSPAASAAGEAAGVGVVVGWLKSNRSRNAKNTAACHRVPAWQAYRGDVRPWSIG